jgi:endonuclease YncB( thermonuclease family)
MERKVAFVFALFVTLLIAGNYLFFSVDNIFPERESVVISRVVDGDTVDLEDGRRIRLVNVNTPEKGRSGSSEATRFLKDFEGEVVEIEIIGVGAYGRILGKLYAEDYINLEIVKLGLAHSYLVEEKELEDFKNAEEEAREKGIGIWERSEKYGCLDVEINKNEEYVSIFDECGVNFEGWTIKDESTKRYKLDGVRVGEFKVYSEKGENKKDEFYWGRGNVWNDDKDSIFIRDGLGGLVYYDSYGY